MQLQTHIPSEPAANPIDYDSQLFLAGSCFVENIGAKLGYYKFQKAVNPFGIMFHPEAIARTFEYAATEKKFEAADMEEVDGYFVSFDAHSRFRAATAKETAAQLNLALTQTRTRLKNASHVFLTLGTAWGYRHKNQGKIVANCHKIPQREFEKELSTVSQLEEILQDILGALQKLNPTACVVFTISPVRHLKDGFVENQRSKAHLITAVHEQVKAGRAFYFPAYELMMDELRDYRFYERDMIHPNALAVDYIWERFAEVYLSTKAKEICEEVAQIQRGIAHRSFNPDTAAHQEFLKKLHLRIQALELRIPHIKF